MKTLLPLLFVLLIAPCFAANDANRLPPVPLPEAKTVSSVSIAPTLTNPVVRPAAITTAGHGAPVNGKPAPQFQLKDPDGKTLKLSDYKGKVVILNFWATWCHYCIAEIPELVALQEKYKSAGLEVIAVSCDDFLRLRKGEVPPDAPLKSKLQTFAAAKHFNFPIVMDTKESSESYPHVGIPALYVIDREGILRATQGDLKKTVEDLLAKK